eukprot:CAMPEP_0179616922 /NCGR_PEP_ID=MMETSP0930-20121108/6884_1 /TAXON_ID=548131 ORGANISM="Ostreococcus mediterraneus, Strain clade-D-RCC1621" /NCGR_SAMPLE_ID=MMETSP0930 /ASSEMBLY_ACC=CAM_ASM_000580 /LENGTH=30 /DNA_ID= /DNA_START= /DNA_END= /DNA_ORIENTATION=
MPMMYCSYTTMPAAAVSSALATALSCSSSA